MFSNDRNNFETYEDYESHPVGKQLLGMPWVWEDGTYPQKKQVDDQPDGFPEAHFSKPAVFKPEKEPFRMEPFKPVKAPALSGSGSGAGLPDAPATDTLGQLAWAYDRQRAFTDERVARHRRNTEKTPLSGPVSGAVSGSPPSGSRENRLLSGKQEPVAEQTPYAGVGALMKPASDQVIEKAVEPLAGKFAESVRNKQAAGMAEEDMSRTADAVTKAVAEAYTGPGYMDAMDAIHQGQTFGMESAYSRDFPEYAGITASIHDGDTHGEGNVMENPDMDALKGFDNSLRDMNLSLQDVRQMGNRIFDPEGQYLDVRGLQRWIDAERASLDAGRVPEVIDFTRLDWRKDPDRVIELGGRYFRQSLLGTHLFGFAVDAMKGYAGHLPAQFLGTVTGIARFYNQADQLPESVFAGGTIASAVEGWDFMVDRLSRNLPFMSRQALRFANSVMTREIKERMFRIVAARLKNKRKEFAEER